MFNLACNIDSAARSFFYGGCLFYASFIVANDEVILKLNISTFSFVGSTLGSSFLLSYACLQILTFLVPNTSWFLENGKRQNNIFCSAK